MSWKLRHAGSPQTISNLTPQQIAEGLVEGDYSPGDEVMGPKDNKWIPMEEHPHFEETVQGFLDSQEEEVHDGHDDHIDMNPLIDVCLVLLVIFIMAQSMAFLEKVIEAPKTSSNRRSTVVRTDQPLPDNMIMLNAEVKDGKPSITVDGSDIAVRELPARLKQIKYNNDKKDTLVIKHKGGVTHGTIVYICDAAAQAGIKSIKLGAESSGAAAAPAAP